VTREGGCACLLPRPLPFREKAPPQSPLKARPFERQGRQGMERASKGGPLALPTVATLLVLTYKSIAALCQEVNARMVTQSLREVNKQHSICN
jgi:hypothetical protein